MNIIKGWKKVNSSWCEEHYITHPAGHAAIIKLKPNNKYGLLMYAEKQPRIQHMAELNAAKSVWKEENESLFRVATLMGVGAEGPYDSLQEAKSDAEKKLKRILLSENI